MHLDYFTRHSIALIRSSMERNRGSNAVSASSRSMFLCVSSKRLASSVHRNPARAEAQTSTRATRAIAALTGPSLQSGRRPRNFQATAAPRLPQARAPRAPRGLESSLACPCRRPHAPSSRSTHGARHGRAALAGSRSESPWALAALRQARQQPMPSFLALPLSTHTTATRGQP